jgi:UDP-glucose 4-epimerase
MHDIYSNDITHTPAPSSGPVSAMHRRVLVTGGSGFIGSHLVEALVQRGADVHCMLLSGDPAPNLDGVRHAIRIHRANLAESAQVDAVVRAARPEVVMHLAAIGVTDVHVDPALAARVNVEGTLNLLGALDGDYRVFVNTGTCHEYGSNEPPFREDQDPRPTLPYAITKTAVSDCHRAPVCRLWTAPGQQHLYPGLHPGRAAGRGL